uniref:Uncharacterized protein n=1 Tax=Rhizophagus irregularis (strain DAOM 181602 / DAOM 197198 / MUCL 43194) TaxID=747089 RepID=U9TKH8_RHIID
MDKSAASQPTINWMQIPRIRTIRGIGASEINRKRKERPFENENDPYFHGSC